MLIDISYGENTGSITLSYFNIDSDSFNENVTTTGNIFIVLLYIAYHFMLPWAYTEVAALLAAWHIIDITNCRQQNKEVQSGTSFSQIFKI